MKLYLKQKVFSFGDKYKFRDKDQNIVFYGKKPLTSITKKYLMDSNNQVIYTIKRKLLSFMPKYTVYKDNEEQLRVNGKFAMRPTFTIIDKNNLEYTIKGDLIAYDFQIYGKDKYIGSISKKFFAIGDQYELDIADDYDASLFCALSLIIDNCLHNQRKKYR